jgi:polyhydroxyalkanoate synthesis repressor PhaR
METTKASPAQSTSGGHAPKRIIKRYSNRKLYDTRDSRYVTLQQIGEMVRAGEEVQIIDNKTKEDKTEVTLALILSEDLKAQPRSVPLTALRDLIQERGGKLLSQLREGTLGRFIAPGAAGEAPAEAKEADVVPEPAKNDKKEKEDEKKPDEKKGRLSELMESSLSSVVPSARAFSELKEEVTALSARVAELEKLLADQKSSRRS